MAANIMPFSMIKMWLMRGPQKARLYPDMEDGVDNFDRDPYWGTFKADNFDFSVIVVHLVPDEKRSKLQEEIKALKDVYTYVQEENIKENKEADDILLVGDFNRNTCDFAVFKGLMSSDALPTMTALFHKKYHKSSIYDKELYDNIFFQSGYLTEYTGECGVVKFDEDCFGNDDEAANLAVSDHRPVWAYFYTDMDGSDFKNIDNDPESADPASQQWVYYTFTGDSYHSDTCGHGGERFKIPLDKAKDCYDPCSLFNKKPQDENQ